MRNTSGLIASLVLGLISLVGYSLVKKGQAPLPAHAEFGSQISTSNVS